MDKQTKIFDSEKTLDVLREIERNPQITQRDLAQKLEISLGKINFLLNALINKGIIEIKNFKNSKNKLAYMYLLTPAGIKIKLELTHKFFIWKLQEYEKLKEEIESLKKEAPFIETVTEKENS
ncbi:MAG: MarR family EPS-associated transcriptional regulator [Candidatus Omnitrophica bacterium]|nr:MarR family EPS-associated transcriptional regulator [Candidatus Omnitrophota bacterium]MDD5238058.1 MarR family EPS-associated transcriptional regulator [Candidatus Omnitrophota bacterium]